MCVIIVKKKGVDLPSKSELQKAYNRNPHGAGFATKDKVYKTLSFADFYENFIKNVTVNDDCIIHFRLATHGSINAKNAHPFKGRTVTFAHNGVLPISSKNDKTDSEILFRSILEPAIELYGLRSHTFNDIVKSVIETSKFAFIDKQGIEMFGNFTELNGLYYSNLNHKPFDERYKAQSKNSFVYRTDDFFANLFAEHNKVYKRSKMI